VLSLLANLSYLQGPSPRYHFKPVRILLSLALFECAMKYLISLGGIFPNFREVLLLPKAALSPR
jgi:hypothetical protein